MQYKVMEIWYLVRHLYTEIQLDNLRLEGSRPRQGTHE